MKKLFTLMAVTLLSLYGSVTANAQAEVDITGRVGYTWNGEESFNFNDDGSITFNSKAWGGLAMWIGGEDWSSYASITYEFAEPAPVPGQINFMAEGGNPCQWYNAGDMSVTLKFGGTDVTQVNQIALQAAGEATFQIKRIYLTEALEYESTPAASLPVSSSNWQLLPPALFAGFSDNAKVEFTVDIQGSANYAGWGIGEFTTPHFLATAESNWQPVEGLRLLTVSGGTDGEAKYVAQIKDLKPLLTSWPDDEGNYGLVANLYGQGGGECTCTLKKIEIFEVVGAEVTDLELSVSDGESINDVYAAAALGVKAGKVTIDLGKDNTVKIFNTLRIADNLTITGEDCTIDAYALNDNVITLNGTSAFAKKADDTDSDHKAVSEVKIEGVTIKGFTGALIKDAQKTLLEKLDIENCVIEMTNSNKNVIDFNGKGYVGSVIVKNSTIYATEKNNGFFAQYGSRPKNVNGDLLQSFVVENSDMVNIAVGKNVCDLKQNGTEQNVYTLKNSIFVNVGKSGQTVVGFNKGQTSNTPKWTVSGNTFNYTVDDEMTDTGAAEAEKAGSGIVTLTVAGIAALVSPEEGDFRLANCAQLHAKVGDPRWIDADLAAVAAELSKEVSTATELLGDTDPESSDAAYRLKNAIGEANTLLESLSLNIDYYQSVLDELKACEEAFKAATGLKKYYIIGNAANEWKRTEIPEMVFNKETQAYEYELTITTTDYFAIVDKVLTPDEDAADSDWGDFNKNHRFALAEGDQDAKVGEAMQLIKCNGTLVLKDAGTYQLSMTTDLKLTITATTGIQTITGAEAADGAYYNMQGVRVAQPTKGVFIHNGRKVVVK